MRIRDGKIRIRDKYPGPATLVLRFRTENSISYLDSILLGCSAAVQEVGGSNPSRDMAVSGALVEGGDMLEITLVKSFHSSNDLLTYGN
jgi:hypothetical protein